MKEKEQLTNVIKRAMDIAERIGMHSTLEDLRAFKKHLAGEITNKPDMTNAWTCTSLISHLKDENSDEVFLKNTIEKCLYYGESAQAIAEAEHPVF